MSESVRSGDPLKIRADEWNEVRRTISAGKVFPRSSMGALPKSVPSPELVSVYNADTVMLEQYRAVGVSGTFSTPPTAEFPTDVGQIEALSEFHERTSLSVKVPVAADVGRWLVIVQDIESGSVGSAVSIGVTPCWVNLTATTDRCVDIVGGQQVPRGGHTGVPLLWVAGGVGTASATGEQWAVVLLGAARLGSFDVRLTQTGGGAGTRTTQCSFTYTVKDITNTYTLGTGVAMAGNGQRVVNAAMTAGTYGRAFYDGSTLKLIWADERIQQTNCT